MVRIATYGLSRSQLRVQKAPILVFQGFQRGVPKTRGVVFMGPHYKDSSVAGSILGSLFSESTKYTLSSLKQMTGLLGGGGMALIVALCRFRSPK